MHFEKVSLKQYAHDVTLYHPEKGGDMFITTLIDETYDEIKLPKQGTARSMGMDFFAPYDIIIPSKEYVVVPTGIRWVANPIDDNLGLIIVPRSGLGFKHGLRLANTIGVIDADYYKADNEGHIMIKLFNPSDDFMEIKQGKGFVQGIVTDFYICDGAESDESRFGGFGSTG